MELKLGGDEPTPKKASSGNVDIVESVEKALENPQIRGMASAILQAQGIDPSQFGLQGQEPPSELPQVEAEPTDTQEDSMSQRDSNITDFTEPSNEQTFSADDILDMLEGISQESPLGSRTTIGQVSGYIEENKGEINQMLEAQGLR